MKPLQNINEFLDTVEQWPKLDMNGQPLLIDNIRGEIAKSFNHIKSQEKLLSDAIVSFKSIVLKQEIRKTFQSFTNQAVNEFVNDIENTNANQQHKE